MKAKELRLINGNYGEFTGTQFYYKYLGGLVLTDGTKHIAEDHGLYWFYDIIYSVQHDKNIKGEYFQLWVLKKYKDGSYVAICSDGNGKDPLSENYDLNDALYHQIIEFTDFEGDAYKVYLIDNVILLPSEY